MFPIQDQISVATRSSIESHVAMLNTLTNKTFESVEKLMSLYFTAAKTSLEESAVTVRQLLSAKNSHEFMSVSASQSQPVMEKLLAYNRHLASIASNAHAEFTRAAEQQISEVNHKVAKLVDDVAKSAPAGSENMIEIVRSTLKTVQTGYEQTVRTTKQAWEAMEANVNMATSQFAPSMSAALAVR